MRITPAEAFVLTVSAFPLLFPNRKALISDVSANHKSCHGIPDDRTVLQSAVKDGYELLLEYCRGAKDSENVGHVFSIDMHPYTGAVYFRFDLCGDGVNALCLVKDEEEQTVAQLIAARTVNADVRNFFEKRFTRSYDSLLSGVLSLHEEDDMSAYEAYLMSQGISDRMQRRIGQAFSRVSFDGTADKSSAFYVSGLRPTSYALALISILRLLDEATDNKEISVSFYGGGAIHVQTATKAAKFHGVTEYFGPLHGVIPQMTSGTEHVIGATLSAQEAGLAAEAKIRDGEVVIHLSSYGMEYPAMDFKFDDLDKRIDTLLDAVVPKSDDYPTTLRQEVSAEV